MKRRSRVIVFHWDALYLNELTAHQTKPMKGVGMEEHPMKPFGFYYSIDDK